MAQSSSLLPPVRRDGEKHLQGSFPWLVPRGEPARLWVSNRGPELGIKHGTGMAKVISTGQDKKMTFLLLREKDLERRKISFTRLDC